MKKISKIISVLAAMPFVCPILAACDDDEYTFVDPIEYTAEKPLIEYIDSNSTEFFDNMLHEARDFDDIANHYREDHRGAKMFLLNYGLEPQIFLPDQCYYIYGNDPMQIVEEFAAYDDGLGYAPYPPEKYGSLLISFYSLFISKPLSNNYTNFDFSYEFGNNCNQYGVYDRYINIFANDECFATFYFKPYVPITQEWFENYLNNNLIWGDTYEI